MMLGMDERESHEDDDPCLCRKFVPENKRVDFEAIRPDKKTGKPKLTVYLRYHRDCPEHGLNLVEGPAKPFNPNKVPQGEGKPE